MWISQHLTTLETQPSVPVCTMVQPPLRLTSRLIVDADRFRDLAMDRKDSFARRPLDISSRSFRVRARRDRKRSGGRMPPVRARSG